MQETGFSSVAASRGAGDTTLGVHANYGSDSTIHTGKFEIPGSLVVYDTIQSLSHTH